MPENSIHKRVKILMVAVILLLAYFLPRIGTGRMQEKKSARENQEETLEKEQQGADGTAAEGDAQKEAKDVKDAQKNEEGGTEKEQQPGGGKLVVLDPGHGGEQERSFFICFLIIAEICLVFYQSWQFTCL